MRSRSPDVGWFPEVESPRRFFMPAPSLTIRGAEGRLLALFPRRTIFFLRNDAPVARQDLDSRTNIIVTKAKLQGLAMEWMESCRPGLRSKSSRLGRDLAEWREILKLRALLRQAGRSRKCGRREESAPVWRGGYVQRSGGHLRVE